MFAVIKLIKVRITIRSELNMVLSFFLNSSLIVCIHMIAMKNFDLRLYYKPPIHQIDSKGLNTIEYIIYFPSKYNEFNCGL